MIIHIRKAPQRGQFSPDHDLPLYKGWKFGFSKKGQTDNDLGVLWLQDYYIPAVKKDNSYYLLILDGHNSHQSGKFQKIAMDNNIYLVWLPSHVSYIL